MGRDGIVTRSYAVLMPRRINRLAPPPRGGQFGLVRERRLGEHFTQQVEPFALFWR